MRLDGEDPPNSRHPPGEVTALLLAWRGGDPEALDRLVPLVYGELKRLARFYIRNERAGHTLEPTAVVHEAYLRLVGRRRVKWQDRAHFFAVAAQTMRRVLVDHARGRDARKRGGAGQRSALAIPTALEPRPVDVVALDQALTKLAIVDADRARVVELRYFGGLTIEETAEVLGQSPATVKRDWKFAKAFLHRELTGSAG